MRTLLGFVGFTLLGAAIMTGIGALADPVEAGPDDITGIPQAAGVAWPGAQPAHGVDISFPQCGRRVEESAPRYVIVGLDGGMPDRPNPCFAEQWRYARQQAGAAVYVNTADNGRGDPTRLGRAMARADLRALAAQGVPRGTPVWLDVELPSVWRGSQARHRAVIAAHLTTLASAGHPVGVYSAPALWRRITGGARVDVPVWVGIGRSSLERAASTCTRRPFGGVRPSVVQRIDSGPDGRALDRNLTCPGVDLAGLALPAGS